METAYKVEELRLIETMATTNEFGHGDALINILRTRKELAKRMLKSGMVSEIQLKEMQSGINYCNALICQRERN